MIRKLLFTIIFFVVAFSAFAQSYHTITIDGSNDFNTTHEEFSDISHDGSSSQKGYFTWDADYLYFGISDAEADYDKMATFMYFDTDPTGLNGSVDAYAWDNNITTPFSCDYVVVWKNQSGSDYIEVMQWQEAKGWTQVASANSSSLSSGDYVVDFSVGTDFREVRVKRSTIGSPSEIKFCSFTEQQWPDYWRYFAFPNEDWSDANRTSGQHIDHYKGFTLNDGYDPNVDNSHDYVMRKNYAFLEFDGDNDYVYYADDATLGMLDGATDYTIEMWIYPIDGTVAEYDYVLSRYYSFGIQMYDQNNDGNVEDWYFRISTDGGSNWSYYNTEGDATLTLDAWNHIAVINNSTNNTLKLFVNGTDVTTSGGYKARSMQASVSNDNLYIGAKKASTPNNSFGGYIDEVRLLNIALDPSDLHTSKTDNAYMNNASTAALFHFDEGSTQYTENEASGTNARLGSSTNGDSAEPSWSTDTSELPFKPASAPVPVELVSFSAVSDGNEIMLQWQTATEVNNYGFEIERNGETIGFVEGAGNSNSPKTYSFTDNVTESGKYSYRLKQIDLDGAYEYSNVVEVNIGTPAEFELAQNYPNPFNPTTTIKYSVPNLQSNSVIVTLNVYNALGEKVATLVNGKRNAGNYSVRFDATNLPSGVYFYTLRVGDFTATKKMILLK